ncbi:hypothetical protein GCM10010977_31530 [Citricoccus zhacaiensis]|uniref:CobW C-terminal domain-containing protein n=1 Tax=Citricoccus zhacaiensis TaxID=489142 RepID=A0ABQ2MC13_9MICC|nr:GTP-binding protein [Citricoccus zhacaiensis]GGO49501.1 hypothetical protein GCM10010977_31530 [Citricoccus zhacaiensis]
MRLTLVSSLDSLCRRQACDLLATSSPEAVVAFHDLLEDGVLVRRVFRPGVGPERHKRRLEHPCPSCAVRLEIVPSVRQAQDEGVGHLILALPEALPAAGVLQALTGGTRRGITLDAVVLACSPSAVEDQIWDRHTLFESGYLALPQDPRTPGEFLMDELALTGAVLLAEPDVVPVDPPARARGLQLLRELAPHAHLTTRAAEVRRDSSCSGGSQEPGGCDAAGSPFGTVRHRLHRPLHPERFHRALEVLAPGCCRLRGQLWMAPAPECRILLKGAGPRVWLENTGPWPAYRDESLPAPPVMLAEGVSHGDLGQPGTVIEATGEGLGTAEFARLLTESQLTEAEMQSGFTGLADPFGLDDTHDTDHRRTP